MKTSNRLSLFPFLLSLLTVTLLIATLMLVSSCDKSTSPKSGSLSGRVILVNDTDDPTLDPVDYSGITVALYQLAVLDTTIVRINQEYPNLGLQISQETEFDHRLQNPLSTVLTDNNGDFSFKNIAYGRYNLTYRKENWGIGFVYQVEISKDDSKLSPHDRYRFTIKEEQQKTRNISLVLYPQVGIPSTITDDFIFRANHTYIAMQDAAFISNVIFENAALLLVKAGSKIDFYGSISTPNDGTRWRILSLSGVLGNVLSPPNAQSRLQKISVNSTSMVTIKNGIMGDTQDGLVVTSDNANISNMAFRGGGTAVVFSGSNMVYKNCIAKDYDDRAHVLNGNTEIKDCIFVRNHDCMILSDSSFEVSNNYFAYNWVGIRPVYGNTSIHNNDFYGNKYSISTLASSPIIERNNFYGSSKYCIQPQPNYVQNSFDFGNPQINHNNFFAQGQIVISLKPDAHPGYYGSGNMGVRQDLDARNNYWKAINVEDVIFDVADDDAIRYSVLYMPKLNNRIQTAGILNQ